MFDKDTLVAWATKTNTFMGHILESQEKTSVILVVSTAKGRKWDGQKVIVANCYLGDISNGKAIVKRNK